MNDTIKILFLDDSLTDIELLQFQLKKDGIKYISEITQDRDSYEKALQVFKPDIILSDYSLPSFDGLMAFQMKQTYSPETPFIILSGTIGEQNAVELIKNGVTDYNLKDKLFGVAPKIIRALSEAREHNDKLIAEQALNLSEERYRYLFYNSPMPMWIYSEETKQFLEINNVAIDKYGYSREEFLSMTIDDIRPLEDKERHNSVLKESSKYGIVHHGIWRHYKKDRQIIFVEITAHLIDYEGRKATLVLSNDITERKKAEDELKHSNILIKKNEEKLKEAQALGHIGSWEIDLAHDKTSWSEELYNIFGIEKTDSEPSSDLLLSFVLPEDIDEVRKNIQESYDSLKDSVFNFRFIRKDGNLRYGYIERRFEFDKNNIAIRYFGIIQDITERQIAEQEILARNKQLRDLSNQLERIREDERTHIAREIHDELGQQITSLKMDIDWVSHKQNNQEAIVLSKLHEMLHLCDGLISTVRRISSDLRPAIIDDLGLIEALEWKCNDFEEKMGIRCKFSSKIKDRKFENLFSINVYRILQETLTNVSRHAGAKSVTVSVSENETELILEISDDGKGINTENTGNRKTLGIMGMKERAALLGGKLTLSGTINKGTQTTLTLPF